MIWSLNIKFWDKLPGHYIQELQGKKIFIEYNLGRNKKENYRVTIKELYDYIFTVTLEENNYSEVKSFSYADVITKTIKIKQ